jgi:hypothetical protein
MAERLGKAMVNGGATRGGVGAARGGVGGAARGRWSGRRRGSGRWSDSGMAEQRAALLGEASADGGTAQGSGGGGATD